MEPSRTCVKCKQTLALSEFPKDHPRTDKPGSIKKYTTCRKCKYELYGKRYKQDHRGKFTRYEVLRVRERKAQAVELLGGKCNDCGGIFHQCVYDFHHLDPNEKEFSPGQVFSRAWKTIEKELAKCVLLCANCHRLRHFGDV